MGSAVYSSDGESTFVDPKLAKELGIEEPEDWNVDYVADYTYLCGAPDVFHCGHLGCMTLRELTEIPGLDDFSDSRLAGLLEWLRDQAREGAYYDYSQIAFLRNKMVELYR